MTKLKATCAAHLSGRWCSVHRHGPRWWLGQWRSSGICGRLSQREPQGLAGAQFVHLSAVSNAHGRQVPWAVVHQHGVVGDGPGNHMAAVEDGKFESAEALQPVRVEPEHIVACLDAGETSLQHVDGPGHRREVDALCGRAALDVGQVGAQGLDELLKRAFGVDASEHPGVHQRAERRAVTGAGEVVVDGVGELTRRPVVAEAVQQCRELAGQASGQLSPGPGSGVNQMMLFEIECVEPWQTVQPVALAGQRGSFAYQTDLESAQLMRFICPLIPRSAAAVGREQLPLSKVPVLAFNGADDPVEQPRNWAGAQQLFPDSRDIALPGQGHNTNNIWGICAGPLTQMFIERASLTHLDTSYLANILAPVFDLTLP